MVIEGILLGDPDSDGDGISDCAEEAIIQATGPSFVLDPGESFPAHPTHHAVNFVRVTSYPSKEKPGFILVYSILTLTMDYGKFSLGAHHGDTEPLLMLWRVEDNRTLILDSVFIHAHEGCSEHRDLWLASGKTCSTAGVCDFTGQQAANETICSELEFSDNRLRVSVSRDKHALYPSAEACNNVTLVCPSNRWTWADLPGSWLNLFGSFVDGILGHVPLPQSTMTPLNPESAPCEDRPGSSFAPFSIHEDCGSPGSGGTGVQRQFPSYNVGEPWRLFITDLTPYGFPGERIEGTGCGNRTRFFGGLGCDGQGGTPVLSWLSEIPPEVLGRMTPSR